MKSPKRLNNVNTLSQWSNSSLSLSSSINTNKRSKGRSGNGDDTSSIGRLAPDSPSLRDPFASSRGLASKSNPISRPNSWVSADQGLPSSVWDTTPRILLAAPSTSVHYLFPDLESPPQPVTRASHIDPSTLPRSQSTGPVRTRYSSLSRSLSPGDVPRLPSRAKATSGNSSPSTNILGPARRIPSAGSTRLIKRRDISNPILPDAPDQGDENAKRRQPSIVLDIAKPKVEFEQSESLDELCRDIIKFIHEGNMGVECRTLRRQPSMADLGGRRGRVGTDGKAIGLLVDVDKSRSNVVREQKTKGVLSDIGNRWSESSRQEGTKHDFQDYRYNIYNSEETNTLDRRQSQSVTSPRTFLDDLPLSPGSSVPTFLDPSQNEIAASPSFSHLEYSAAGSSTSAMARTGVPSFHGPASVAMQRSTATPGWGGYAAAKAVVRADKEMRDNVKRDSRVLRASLRRSISLKRWLEVSEESDSLNDKPSPRRRPRSQTMPSIRDAVISAPIREQSHPTLQRRISQPGRGIYLGDAAIDLGGPYGPSLSPDISLKPKSERPWGSVASYETSQYAQTTPTSACFSSESHPRDHWFRGGHGRPLHPDLASEISLMAPSSVGLDLSPCSTPASLPESLEAEVLDLTERGKGLSGLSGIERLRRDDLRKGSEKGVRNPKTDLIAQNTFYLPPMSLRHQIKRLKNTTPAKEVSLNVRILNNDGSQVSRVSPDIGHTFESPNLPAATPTLQSTSSTLPTSASSRRNLNHLCSPPNAIDDLAPFQTERQAQNLPMKPLRSYKSSPFLSASASFRHIFAGRKKDGPDFVPRTLEDAFENQDAQTGRDNGRGDQRWRETLLHQVVGMSLSEKGKGKSKSRRHATTSSRADEKMLSSTSRSRMPIPGPLLGPLDLSEDISKLEGIGPNRWGGQGLRSIPMEREVKVYLPYMPDQQGRTTPSRPIDTLPELVSRWSPSPVKTTKKRLPTLMRREIISPPLPSFGSMNPDTLNAIVKHDSGSIAVPVTSPDMAGGRTSFQSPLVGSSSTWSEEPKLFKTVDKSMISAPRSVAAQGNSMLCLTPPFSPPMSEFTVAQLPSGPTKSTSSMTLRLLGKKSLRKPPLKSALKSPGISSQDVSQPAKSLLQHLIERDSATTKARVDGDSHDVVHPTVLEALTEDAQKSVLANKEEKVLAWREGVGTERGYGRLEALIVGHVEREKETFKGISHGASGPEYV